MKLLLSGLLLAFPCILNADIGTNYSISVNGPVAELEFSCGDPCKLDEQETIGNSGSNLIRTETIEDDKRDTVVTGSRIKRKGGMDPGRDGIQCLGNCSSGNKSTRMVFEARRELREGIKVTISGGRAHFVFYSVVDTEKGPATRLQHSEFRIDRPLIQLNLHGHEVKILTAMENFKSTNWLSDRNP